MKKLIITENDKEYIKSLYGILNEQKTPQVSNDSGLFSKMKASNNYYWEQAYSNTNETDEKKIEEAKQLSLKALFNQLSSNKNRYNESGVCYIITKLEGGRYKSVAYIHKDSIDGVNHGCFDENAPKASTEKPMVKSTTPLPTIKPTPLSTVQQSNVNNNEIKMPNWAIGQKMNFYDNKEQTGNPYNIKISSNPDDIKTNGLDGIFDIVIDSAFAFNLLRFDCNSQTDLGVFEIYDPRNGRFQKVWNKTIAEKYFVPHFCSKNSQGRWVPKVENPDFSQTTTNKQPRIV